MTKTLKNSLTLALVSTDYPPDPKGTGIGTYTYLLAHALVEQGHKVHVVTRTHPKQNQSDQKEGLELHFVDVERPDIPLELKGLSALSFALTSFFSELRYRRKLAATLEQLIRTEGIQLIEAVDSLAEAVFFNTKKHPQIPFIVKLHTPLSVGELFDQNVSEPIRKVIRSFERKLLVKASHLSVPSRAGHKLFRKEMHLHNRPITDLVNPPPKHLKARASRLPEGKEVLYVGRITRTKGMYPFMQAIPKVLKEVPDAQFHLIGRDAGSAEAFDEKIAMLTQNMTENERQSVHFHGHLPYSDIEPYFEQASLCVIPSLFDNFPYTCLEAMSFAKAIVSSDQGGMVEMLNNGNCGKLYSPTDSDTLAKHMIDLLKNPEQAFDLGQKAQARFLEKYQTDVVLTHTLSFYERCRKELYV